MEMLQARHSAHPDFAGKANTHEWVTAIITNSAHVIDLAGNPVIQAISVETRVGIQHI